MYQWLKKELKTLGFVKVPYEPLTVGRSMDFLQESVRLVKSSLYEGSYMMGFRILVSRSQGVLGYIDPSKGSYVVLDYWMGPDGIKPVEWSDSQAWSPSEKEKMLEVFLQKGLPWLGHYSDPIRLVDQLIDWQECGFPSSPRWPKLKARKIPVHILYIAALYEYLGEMGKFKDALERWIEFLNPDVLSDKQERGKCVEYLNRVENVLQSGM